MLRVLVLATALPAAFSWGVGSPIPSTQRAKPTAQRADVGRVRAIAELVRTDKKPALGNVLPDCPPTIWSADDLDVDAWQKTYREERDGRVCPIEIEATPAANAAGKEYFVQRREEFKEMLEEHGTIWFKGFDLMKDPDGFREFWESLDLDPCLDPIHSSGLRKFLSKKDAVYEEVNKQALSKHYIGLHNESTFKKTATTGAFVCFKPATIKGGEFMIADGEAIFRDMDPEILKKLIENKVRISVSNLDFDFLLPLPDSPKEAAMEKLKTMVDEMIAPKFDMDLDMIYGTDGKDMRLQAIENPQSPVNRHPKTGRPVWFCNMHNHARYLRERRPCSVPEVGMTDVFWGDLSIIPGDVLDHVNEVCEKNIARVPMQPGDVLLCDNYRVLHGRDIFEGDRLHAVSWFGEQPEGVERKEQDAASNVLNSFINKFVVGE